MPESLAVIDSRGPVRATLEVAAGTAARLNIRVGDKVLQRIFGTAQWPAVCPGLRVGGAVDRQRVRSPCAPPAA